MNIFDKIKLMFYQKKTSIQDRIYQKRYSDYHGETSYDCGEYQFIWGVKSNADMSQSPACLYTMNDIDIVYSREKRRYILELETAIWFDKKEDEIEHLSFLLGEFTKYMTQNNLSIDEPYKFWMSKPYVLLEGETLPEVYTNFRIFVEGYKSVHRTLNNQKFEYI